MRDVIPATGISPTELQCLEKMLELVEEKVAGHEKELKDLILKKRSLAKRLKFLRDTLDEPT